MSFSHDVKTELCGILPEGSFGKKAELYGLLLFSRALTPSSAIVQTEHEGTACLAERLLRELYQIEPQKKAAGRAGRRALVAVSAGGAAPRIYRSFGYDEKTVSLRINRANMETEADAAAFVRGAFLACGTVENPDNYYHMEFVTPFLNLSRDLSRMLSDAGFEPKNAARKGNYVVYFKESEQIEDLLTYMGATRQSLELMNIKIYKDLRNKVNRVTNCETANIGKTVNASALQMEAIRNIQNAMGLDALPEELREIAQLRLDHPEVSLRELGGLTGTPLSRSGVNHRLRKIMEFAGRLKKVK